MVVIRVKALVVLVVVVVVKRLGNRVDAIGEIFKLFDGVGARGSLTGETRSKISFSTPVVSTLSMWLQ